ncbi:MAG: ATP-binding protein [Nonlabens sp.]|uniref:hybrid sensor histidine kinase/response regulator transcription factor n=1 Tax=Nonlabens sp. TaxID=1888209 RepID=UPI003EF69239
MLPFISLGQTSSLFKSIEGASTASQSICYAVVQEKSGMIWIATEEGVLSHNSIDFKTYNSNNGLDPELSDRITTLFIDLNDQLYIGTETGLGIYNSHLDQFQKVAARNDNNPSLITKIIKSEDGRIFVAAFNGLWTQSGVDEPLERVGDFKQINFIENTKSGVLVAHQNKVTLVPYSMKMEDVIDFPVPLNQSVTAIGRIGQKLIAGTDSGQLFEFDPNSEVVFQPLGNFKNKIKDILLFNENTIYLATDGNGLFKLGEDWSIQQHFRDDDSSLEYIASNGVYDIEKGINDEIWIATYGGGISKLSTSGVAFTNHKHRNSDENSIASDLTRAIVQDGVGNIWFGTKKGISIWHRKNNTWRHLPSLKKNSPEFSIVLALEKRGNDIYVGTFNHGLFKIQITDLKVQSLNDEVVSQGAAKSVYSILSTDSQTIWIAGLQGELARLENDVVVKTLPIQNIRKLVRFDTHYILAVGRKGAFKIDIRDNSFSLLDAVANKTEDINYSTLNDVIKFNDLLLFASNGEGILIYDLNNESVRTLGIEEGLPSDNIQSIISIKENEFWVATTRGLAHVIKSDNGQQIFVYNESDGLASTEFNYGSSAILDDGKLIAFGGTNGVSIFNPLNIKTTGPVPYLKLIDVEVFNERLVPGTKELPESLDQISKIELSSDQTSIELSYIGVLHSAPEQVTYSHRLKGFDDKWSLPTTQNFQSFTNLGSGDYVFEVKALNKYKESSPVRAVAIKIATPWYATRVAVLLYLFALLAIVYGVIHFTRVMVRKRNADEQIAFFNNVTHEIKTPLTILMSSLDKVTSDIADTDESKKRIKTTVKRINSLFEQMLNFHKVTSENSITQHVTQLQVDKHITNLTESFAPLTEERNIRINVNSRLTNPVFHHDRDILDKVILNLISNAIKYSNAQSEINVDLSNTQDKQLQVKITDHGIGIPQEQQKHILKKYYRARNVINSQRPGTGLGLVMVKKLLDKTGGSISFVSEENVGTAFTVVLHDLKKLYEEKEIQKIHNINASTEDFDLLQLEVGNLSDAKILVCEDNDELRNLMVSALGNYFQVFEAINGQQGLEMALQHYPDIILTDLIMPEMDGMQMARQLKADINLNHIPVFMLTVLQNSSQKLESIESGVSEYIEKPIDMKILLAKIVNTLNFQTQLRKKYRQEQDSDTAAVFKNKQDQEFLEKLESNIVEHLGDESFSVHDLSGSMGMSRTSLYMKLKNLVDLSPQDFIIHTKLKVAKKLLIEGEMSIKEVAYQSGFSNPKYFSTSFKKFYNLTPSGFLDSLKK